jgi:FkbM family methyltransferase
MKHKLLNLLQETTSFERPPFWGLVGQIFVCGTGSSGRDIYGLLTARSIPIAGFMDHRIPEKAPATEIRCYLPEEIPIGEQKAAILILSFHNRAVDMPALQTRLKWSGYCQFISMIDLYDHFAAELGTRYWLTNRGFYRNFETQICETNALCADDLSRATFAKTLQFRITGDYSVIPEPDMQHQYFPTDLPRWKLPLRRIDCGAYDGDAIRGFAKNRYRFSALAAFELDIQSYANLAGFMREYGKTIPEISLWRCGVNATSHQLRFTSGVGESSSIDESGEPVVQCVALDEALPNFAPTLIKMDIEGTEPEALLGARHLIATYQPGLAISAYHAPAHLWEIPLWGPQFASDNGIAYTYYLRSNARNCFDTVFYAIPTS